MKEHRWKYLKYAVALFFLTVLFGITLVVSWANDENWVEKICIFGVTIACGISGFENLKCFFISQKTKSKGEVCYGKICGIIDSREDDLDRYYLDVSGTTVSKVDVYFFVESEYEFKMLTTNIKTTMKEYTLGSYVKCKYYNNNIIIEELIQIDEIPKEIITGLKNKELADYVIINGIEYVKNIGGNL